MGSRGGRKGGKGDCLRCMEGSEVWESGMEEVRKGRKEGKGG